jgi:TRAP-type uncharacterized transport system fused permease subunit
VTDDFTWNAFLTTTVTCAIGIVLLGGALTGFLFAPIHWLGRWLLGLGALLLVFPNLTAGLIGLLLVAPVLVLQLGRRSSITLAAPP